MAMLFRPTRIVHATTEQEIDAALGSADKVVVEGNDRLLSYAVAMASRDAQNRIDVKTATATELPVEVTVSVIPHQLRNLKFILALLGLIGLIAVGGFFWSWLGHRAFTTQVSDIQAPEPAPATVNRPESQAEKPSNPLPPPGSIKEVKVPPPSPVIVTEPAGHQNVPELLRTLAWPVVTTVAILALFLIAWQAISRGSNVEISWKVTEKVTGRVVITKVRTRTTKATKQAA
jgi:hypothetical protein